jgi:hypothetical protein
MLRDVGYNKAAVDGHLQQLWRQPCDDQDELILHHVKAQSGLSAGLLRALPVPTSLRSPSFQDEVRYQLYNLVHKLTKEHLLNWLEAEIEDCPVRTAVCNAVCIGEGEFEMQRDLRNRGVLVSDNAAVALYRAVCNVQTHIEILGRSTAAASVREALESVHGSVQERARLRHEVLSVGVAQGLITQAESDWLLQATG